MSQIADELSLSASWTKAGTVLVIVGGGSNWDPTPQFAWRAGSGPWNLLGTADLAGSSINAWTLTGVGSAATEIRFTEDEGALREYVIPLEGTPPQPVTPPDPDPGPDPAPDPEPEPEPEPDPEPTGEPGTFEDRNIAPPPPVSLLPPLLPAPVLSLPLAPLPVPVLPVPLLLPLPPVPFSILPFSLLPLPPPSRSCHTPLAVMPPSATVRRCPSLSGDVGKGGGKGGGRDARTRSSVPDTPPRRVGTGQGWHIRRGTAKKTLSKKGKLPQTP